MMRADVVPASPRGAGREVSLQPARVGLRLAAYLVDWLVTVILASVLVSLGGLQLYFTAGRGRHDPPDASVYAVFVISLLTLPLWALTTLIGWSRAGRSIGKLAVGLRIVDRGGRRPGVLRSLVRLLVYALEHLPLVLLPGVTALWLARDAVLSVWVRPLALEVVLAALAAMPPPVVGRGGRALHDRAAGTVVVAE